MAEPNPHLKGSPSPVILVVDDDDSVRQMMCAILQRNGYSVLDASDGKGALTICDGHQGDIQMLLTDITMPQMSGVELADLVSARHPQIKVLFVSGYSTEATIHRKLPGSAHGFLAKPFTHEELTHKINELLS